FSDYFGEELTNFNLLKNRNLCDNDFLNFINSILISIDNSYKILKKEIKKDKIKSLLKDLIIIFYYNIKPKNLIYRNLIWEYWDATIDTYNMTIVKKK
ncbi:MAG: hypothetical protein LN408_04815, partial [Candidatus Thermoplasmatota archaeon]|nr:hypothetical protein [Candidatus Thermoplasmatota archaeon]